MTIGNGKSATTQAWGNGTRTTYSDGTSATTYPWGNGTRTTYSDGTSADTHSLGNGTRTTCSGRKGENAKKNVVPAASATSEKQDKGKDSKTKR